MDATSVPSPVSTPASAPSSSVPESEHEPRRFIFSQADMDHFRNSPAKKDLLGFATALGRSCAPSSSSSYKYDPNEPLTGLSPAMASVHGSIRQMSERWLSEIPPDGHARARFGNPAFRTWHGRLVERSRAIVKSALDCHRVYVVEKTGRGSGAADVGGRDESQSQSQWEVLQSCSEAGYAAAGGAPSPLPSASAGGGTSASASSSSSSADDEKELRIIEEIRAYLHQSFGHPTRLDYGTGHESSFLIFLYALCKLRCIGDGTGTPPEPRHMAPVALSVFSQYLSVTRGLQKDYMLEPAGSHGVWGLDDYHCLPFYFGACQLQDNDEDVTPRSIHDDALLKRRGDDLMYLGCIRYVKALKPSVPFFESSPMLDDISNLPSWGRVSRGLLRLYEGEVLDKMPVVQHFVFGTFFRATWTPSAQPREAPTRTFINGPGGEECIAPWAQASSDVPGGGELPPLARQLGRNS